MKKDEEALCALVKFIGEKQVEELLTPEQATVPRAGGHPDAQIILSPTGIVRLMTLNDEGVAVYSKPIRNIKNGESLLARYQAIGHITKEVKEERDNFLWELHKSGIPSFSEIMFRLLDAIKEEAKPLRRLKKNRPPIH